MAKKFDEIAAGYRYAMDSHFEDVLKGRSEMFFTFKFLSLEKVGLSPTKKRKKGGRR